jgi:hypothetical protein
MIEWMNTFFDQAHRAILAESVPKALMLHQPFAMIAEILGRALQEIKPLKGTGELGPGGDELIYAIADARYKADRNSNLIRQMTVEPRTFVSAIDRDGLVAMARISADAQTILAQCPLSGPARHLWMLRQELCQRQTGRRLGNRVAQF